MDNGTEVLLKTHGRRQMEAEMKATIKRVCGEDNLNDRPVTGEEDELSGDGCDTTAVVDDMLLEGQKAPSLPLHLTSDGNNNEREDIGVTGSLILASERETPSQSEESEEIMLTLNKEPVNEPELGDGCSLETDEDATDLMTAICRVLPELQALNPTCARRHSCEFRQDPPTEMGGSSRYCRRGTAPSLLFVSSHISLAPEDDAQQIVVSEGTLDACLSHENSCVDNPHPEMKGKEKQNDSCTLQKVEDDGRAKETISETSETLDVIIDNRVANEHPAMLSISDREVKQGDQGDAVVEHADENEVELEQVEENPVLMMGHDTDQDYELEIAVGENQIDDLGQEVPQSAKNDDELPAVHTTKDTPQIIDGEPHYATVIKGRDVPVPPEESKYVNYQVSPSDAQGGGVSAPPEVGTENAEHVYDYPKEAREASGPSNNESHALESSISGVCRQEAGCEGAPATSEPIYETIEDGNERDNNNEGNGPDCGKATSCVVRRRCFCLVLGRLHVLPVSRLLVHLLACRSQWWWCLLMLC